jgi:tetratricopeptide (TPR) repeat protein
MKKIKLLFFMAAIGTYSFAATPADSARIRKESMDLYKFAMGYNDLTTAAQSLSQYLLNGGDANFKDSLAIIYYELNNLAGAYKISNEQYTVNNKNVTALTLLADITGRGRDAKISLDWYDKLCAVNPTPFNWYQLATKQFTIERKLECRQSLNKIIADSTAAAKQNVTLDIGNGYSENVPAIAAAYNMLAVLEFQDKKTEEAKKLYNKAIALFPDFVIAKQNLQALSKPAAKPVAKPKGK